MYKVLLVDDEPEICKGVRLRVDWESMGLSVVGEAYNGSDAIAVLNSTQVDILITDMNMPGVNGSQLLSWCHDNQPDVKIIVLTGYDDFEYAKVAIKTRVQDFLLKPIAREELVSTLTKVILGLDELATRISLEQAEIESEAEYQSMLIERLILHVVKQPDGRLPISKEELDKLNMAQWTTQPVIFVTVGVQNSAVVTSRDDLSDHFVDGQAFINLLTEFKLSYDATSQFFFDLNYPMCGHYVILVGQVDIDKYKRDLGNFLANKVESQAVVANGEIVQGMAQWRQGYLSSVLTWNSYLANEHISEEVRFANEGLLRESELRRFFWILIDGDIKQLETMIDSSLSKAFIVSQLQFIKSIFQFLMQIELASVSLGVDLKGATQLWLRPEQVWGFQSVLSAKQFLMQTIHVMQGEASRAARASENADVVMQQMREFIEENYMHDLNLTLLAERFHYNTSYLSELFRLKIGKTFIDYMTEIRMRHASRLLKETSLHITSIIELIGFSNVSYFSTKFKKFYGTSPSEYRQNSDKQS